ncbi:MAG: 4-hydroxythreonine-4-phosphate dehydrogenase PdxA, partial [Bacteroidales bacterium]
MSKIDEKIRVGITQGDCNGISNEVIIKTLMDARIYEICTPILYGSSKVASYHRKVMDVVDFNFNTIKSASEAHSKRANLVNCYDKEVKIEMGKSSQVAGELSVVAMEVAVEDLKKNNIDVLVTAPINKYSIQSQNFNYPGHTEFLADNSKLE